MGDGLVGPRPPPPGAGPMVMAFVVLRILAPGGRVKMGAGTLVTAAGGTDGVDVDESGAWIWNLPPGESIVTCCVKGRPGSWAAMRSVSGVKKRNPLIVTNGMYPPRA